MRQIDSAGVILYHINSKNELEFLLLHYPHGHWDFPKGKIESGESKKTAALRELFEETGLSADLIENFEERFSYIFTDTDGNLVRKVVHFFIGKTHTPEVIISDEHVGFAWLSFEKAYRKLTFENAQNILKLACEFITNA